jgi:hypothetical protein
MSVADLNLMLGLDPETGNVAALWLGAALAALAAIFFVRVFGRGGLPGLPGPAAAFARYAAVALALLVAWTFFDRLVLRERADERRALEMRANALTARALAPGSPLACLDASAGEVVEAACESALFANPETVAAAVSYVVARLTLLSDGTEFANRGDAAYDTTLADLRRSAETDRFGFVSYVLASRDRCTAERCAAFGLLSDASRVRENLKEGIFEKHLARHVVAWQSAAVLAASPPEKPPSPSTGAVSNNWNYPSAASIPPVSIMTNEPSGPPPSAPAATVTPPAALANAPVEPGAAPTPPRRPAAAPPRRQASPAQNATPGPPGPTQLGPLPPPPPPPAAANTGAPAIQ